MPLIKGLRESPHDTDPRLLMDTDQIAEHAKQQKTKNSLQEKQERTIGFSPTARHEIQDIVGRAMAGTLPRFRDLKEWEPNKLNARHIQMVMLKASGLPNKEIAEILDVGEANVSVVLNHPDAEYLLVRVISYAAEKSTDIPARIKAHAGEMLDIALHHARHGPAEVASRNAFKLLAMAGHGEEKVVKQKHEFTASKEQVGALVTAIRESRELSQSMDVTRFSAHHDTEQGVAPLETEG